MDFKAQLTANRGEWAEIYTMFKLLAEGKLYAADENTNKIPEIFLPILSVIREEIKDNVYDYRVGNKIEIYFNDKFVFSLDIKEFAKQASTLFKVINSSQGASFASPETEAFMTSIFINKVKQSGEKKADIFLKIQEINSGMVLNSGFSIKTNFKAKAHLINSSEATNFIYQINDFDDSKMNKVNQINTRTKIQDRVKYIYENSSSIVFEKTYRNMTCKNLMLIDSRMPEIIGYALYNHYFNNISICYDIVDKLIDNDPLVFKNGLMYSYKFKKLLCACALGMSLGKEWDGIEEANGGYIIVKDDGDIVAHHIYNRDIFEAFLLKETKFERGSTDRHNYCKVYKENDKYYIKLNLAIRFK